MLNLGAGAIDGLKLGAADVSRLYLSGNVIWEAGGSFSPADYSPALWFDSADAATITLDTGLVSQWNNKGSAPFNVNQINPSARPVVMPGELNGLNIIRFTASPNTYLHVPPELGFNMNSCFDSTGTTVFIVKKYISGVVEFKVQNAIANRINFEGGNRIDLPNDSTSKLTSDSTTNTWVCMLGRREATQLRFYYDGTLKATASNTNSLAAGAASIGVGATAGGANAAAMDVAEILVYPRALSAAEINNVLSYIEAKWGVAQAEVAA